MATKVKIETVDRYGRPTGEVVILSPPEARNLVSGMGMTLGDFPEALSIPYEIDFPWSVPLLYSGELVGIVSGTVPAIKELA